MKKIKLVLVAVCTLVLTGCSTFAGAKNGDYYYGIGQTQESEKNYSKALKSYSKAAALYVDEKETAKLILAKDGLYRTKSVLHDFAYSLSKFKSSIKKKYPWATKDDIDGWLNTKKPFVTMDMDGGKTYYNTGEVDNLKYRNQDIMDANNGYHKNPMKKFMDLMLNTYVKTDYSNFTIPYDRPMDLLADIQLVIKKSKLPKNGDGIVRVWWPMPINTGCQNSIVVISLEPSEYIVQQTDPNSDIGICYFEIPIAKIEKELVIRSQVRFKHYQQRFIIDPGSIQAYDTGSDLYKKYTASTLNTAITPEIQARARQIVGSETNPYLAAKLLNDYIIANVDYSFPEYDAVDAYRTPLSTYVEEHQFGDCGFQSVYFSAMCRSIGIPARAAGGFQYFTGKPQSHFWAEFYLPEPYNGWIPVDVTASEMSNEVIEYSQEDVKAFSDYFFAQQDPMRMVTQNDVDVPLSPESEDGNYYFKACLQDPVILFYSSDKIVTAFSSERKLLLNGTYSFNYENAIAAKSGIEIQLNATDFGLELFNEKTKFQLKDNYLGKDITKKLEVKEFNAGKTTVTLILPENIQNIAYKLACIPLNGEEKISTRWVIINK